MNDLHELVPSDTRKEDSEKLKYNGWRRPSSENLPLQQPQIPTTLAMTQHLTIEFPESAKLPQGLAEDQDFLRYTVVASLYQRGKLSGRAARELTGDSRRRFEEKMAEYGYPLLGSETDDISAELNA